MLVNQNKIFKIVFVIFLLFIIIIQLINSRGLSEEKKMLSSKISVQQRQNYNLEADYLKQNNSVNEKTIKQATFDLKKKTALILSEAENYNLELIDFNSSKAELNLNLKGNFSDVLNFIFFLEKQIKELVIGEFKIKKSDSKLFFYLKLKNGLI